MWHSLQNSTVVVYSDKPQIQIQAESEPLSIPGVILEMLVCDSRDELDKKIMLTAKHFALTQKHLGIQPS